jgi:hypothetical protein
MHQYRFDPEAAAARRRSGEAAKLFSHLLGVGLEASLARTA